MQPDVACEPGPGDEWGWLMRQCGTVRQAATFGGRHRRAVAAWGPMAFLMEWSRRRSAPGGPRDAMGCVVPQIARRIARMAFMANAECAAQWPDSAVHTQITLLNRVLDRTLGRSPCNITATRQSYPQAGTVAIEQLANLAIICVRSSPRDFTPTYGLGVTCTFHVREADAQRYALVDSKELPDRFYLDTVGAPVCISCFERSSGYKLQKHIIDEPAADGLPCLRATEIKANAGRLDRTRINLTHVRLGDESYTVTGTKAYILRASACRALRAEKRDRAEAAARESAAARRAKRAAAARRKRARDRELECHRAARARRLECMSRFNPGRLPDAFVRALWNAELPVGSPDDDPEADTWQRVARAWGADIDYDKWR